MEKHFKMAPHETYELHEILTFKNICATKSSVMVGLVKDTGLKALMQEDFIVSQAHIKELRDLLEASELMEREADDITRH